MIRRPRFPLTLRLAWIERELAHAAALLPLMIEDIKAMRAQADAADVRTVLVASITTAALLLMGVDPRTLEAFVTEIAPGGDLVRAEALSAEIMGQVMLLMGDDQDDDGARH